MRRTKPSESTWPMRSLMSDESFHTDAWKSPWGARVRRVLPWAGVMVLAAGVFVPCLDTGTFVNGPDSVLRLPLLSHYRNIPTLFTGDFMAFTEGEYRPLSYALLALVRGFVPADRAVFWHAWPVAFHVLNTVLVFALARRFARKTLAAVLAAGLFAAHPLASVFGNNMNQFHYVLAGSFYLGTLACYVQFVRSRRVWRYLLGLVLFLAGLFTSRILLTLPVFLLLYEFLYERPGARTTLARVLPFAASCLVPACCWLMLRPGPLLYEYPNLRTGEGWFSFYTFVGQAGLIFKAVAGGLGFEPPLTEIADRIWTPTDLRFLLWAAMIVMAAVLAVHELVRKRWLGIGILLAMVSVAPYVSTTFHRADDLLSWSHLYLVPAGFALAVGALVDRALEGSPNAIRCVWGPLRRLLLRTSAAFLAVLLVAYYGAALVRANLTTRSARDYWQHVLSLNAKSETASVELGKACLAARDYDAALRYLFSPAVKSMTRSHLEMVRYYCSSGDNALLAAAVHFRSASSAEMTDLRLQSRIWMAGAEFTYAAGALDYAEYALSRVLMTNPYDTAALRMLAGVLSRKGYARGALVHLEKARRIDPGDVETAREIRRLRARMYYPGDSNVPGIVTPPGPDWLEYAVSDRMNPGISDDIVRLSDRLPQDPVVQLEAGVCLLGLGETERARRKLDVAVRSMPAHPYVWASGRRADGEAGLSGETWPVGTLPPRRDAAMWNNMGYLVFLQGRLDQAISCFRAALKVDPGFARAHYNLGLALAGQGQRPAAVEQYQSAIALAPLDPEPYRSLAAALVTQGSFAECIEVLSAGVKAIPGDRELRLRLAWVLSVAPEARLRDGAKAVELAEAACQDAVQPDVNALHTLAAAYAEAGQFEKALATARKAVGLARAQGNEELAKTGEDRLRLYERRQAYRADKSKSLP